MKKFITLTLGLFSILGVIGQEVSNNWCSHNHATEEALSSFSLEERQKYYEETENYVKQFSAKKAAVGELSDIEKSRGSILYTIPVVFHIVHGGGVENISDEQVLSALEIMNRDFQLLNNDANNVNSNFSALVADIQVEFKLAKRDPNGNCTNGITRTFNPSATEAGTSESARVQAVINEHGVWPGDEYLNIFITKGLQLEGAAAYTYRPQGTGPFAFGDNMSQGIHSRHDFVGNIGTSTNYTSRTLTHEAGHWLGLPHTWGSTNDPGLAGNCSSDDGINDTPNTIGWQSCNVNGTSCNSLDNVENYMEYSYCSKMFTTGQKNVMQGVLNDGIGNRDNLYSAFNITNTGVNEPDQLCRADFDASFYQVCVGSQVTFTDFSFHGPISWDWTFPGTMEGTSSDQNPTVTYDTPGTYSVTLAVSDGTNTVTETKNAFITVLPTSAPAPFMESFESVTSLPSTDWFVENPGNNSAFQIGNVGHTGVKSARLANFGQPAGNIDELISAPIDLSSITDGMTLTFRYAYRKRSAANEEWLRVSVSNNCGETWAQRKTIKGDNLSPLIATSSWTPSSQDDWVTVHMTNITSTFWVDNARVKFQFEADGGNNFYLDDINIYAGDPQNLSVEESSMFTDFNVYPNPTEGELNIQFTTENSANYTIELVNMLGQVVESSIIQANAGSNLVMMGTEQLRNGVYMLRINTGSAQIIRQVVVR